MTTDNITVQNLRTLIIHCANFLEIDEKECKAGLEAIATKAARTDALEDTVNRQSDLLNTFAARAQSLEAENAALLAERVELGGIIGSLDSTNAALVKERDALVERCAKIADKYTCGSCGMDGKSASEIRRILGDPSVSVTVSHGTLKTTDLAQAHDKAAQEPVAWITRDELSNLTDLTADACVYWCESGHVAESDEIALYAAPQQASEQREPTDAEITRVWEQTLPVEGLSFDSDKEIIEFARAIRRWSKT